MTQLIHREEDGMLLHVRFDGRSEEMPLDVLQLGPDASDDEIREAVAARFDRSLAHFSRHVIVRTSQAIIVRPEAIYG
jgi:hypothetical protein